MQQNVLTLFVILPRRRRAPGKLGKRKKKKFVHHAEEGEAESANKLIKFGPLPSYRLDK